MAQRPDRGEVADYIPELARVDPNAFGLAVIDADGHVACGGDADVPFSIQSISKVFTLTLALGKVGDRLWRRVGREPSGSAVQLHRPARARARHPAQSLHQCRRDRRHRRDPVRPPAARGARRDPALHAVSGRRLRRSSIDEAVAASEQRTGFRNAALANYMKSFGVLDNPVDYTLGVYFHHCAIAMSLPAARDGRALPRPSRPQSVDRACRWCRPQRARRINALMLTCGHYDGSGEFAYRVGLPGKSGVGGGILAVAPGKASIAVWSPGLDAVGQLASRPHRAGSADQADGLVDLRRREPHLAAGTTKGRNACTPALRQICDVHAPRRRRCRVSLRLAAARRASPLRDTSSRSSRRLAMRVDGLRPARAGRDRPAAGTAADRELIDLRGCLRSGSYSLISSCSLRDLQCLSAPAASRLYISGLHSRRATCSSKNQHLLISWACRFACLLAFSQRCERASLR